MHYWLAVASLFKTLQNNENEHPLNTLEINPKEIFTHARTCLRTLIRLHYTSHGDECYELFTVLLAQYIGFSALRNRNVPQETADRSIQEINDTDVLIYAYILRGQARMAYLSDVVLRIMDMYVPAELQSQMSNLIGKREEANMVSIAPPVQGDWPIHIGTILDRDKRRLGNLFRAITEAALDNREDNDSLVDEVE
jgi:hypothetical protein